MVRLFQKNEIEKLSSIEKRAEIEEGMKLARRIDTLRSTLADEEKKVRLFRENTTQRVVDEINEKILYRDSLQREIAELKDQRRLLMMPIVDELEAISEQKIILREEKDRLSQEEKIFEKDKREFLIVQEELRYEKKGIEFLRSQLQRNLEESETNLSYQRDSISNIEKEKAAFDLFVKQTNSTLTERERRLAIRENDLENKRKNTNIHQRNKALNQLHEHRSK